MKIFESHLCPGSMGKAVMRDSGQAGEPKASVS